VPGLLYLHDAALKERDNLIALLASIVLGRQRTQILEVLDIERCRSRFAPPHCRLTGGKSLLCQARWSIGSVLRLPVLSWSSPATTYDTTQSVPWTKKEQLGNFKGSIAISSGRGGSSISLSRSCSRAWTMTTWCAARGFPFLRQ
jgi:hypothetical protein